MAASPPREVQDDTGGAQSPEAEEHSTSMENRDQQEGNQSSGFDFDIKEQDRWLPIANGEYSYFYWRVWSTRCAEGNEHRFSIRALQIRHLRSFSLSRCYLLLCSCPYFGSSQLA